MNPSKKDLVILVNLGTPASPSFLGVMQFLAKFLSDKRVVGLPSIIWKSILYILILPLRSFRTRRLYKKIWTAEGSPLQVWTERLTNRVRLSLSHLEKAPEVMYAMTYSFPNLEVLLKKRLKEKINKLMIIPLFPFYSTSTSAAVWDIVGRSFKKYHSLPSIQFIRAYGQEGPFYSALAKSIMRFWEDNGPSERLLFSFHGIPKRNVLKGDPYMDACIQAVKEVIKILNIPENIAFFSFQSRFGFSEWIRPYTENVLVQWAVSGVKTVDILCPSFSVDCLETLEEIAIQNKQIFLNAGGLCLRYIPALNDNQEHADVLVEVISKYF